MKRLIPVLIINLTLILRPALVLAEGNRLTLGQFLEKVQTANPDLTTEKANVTASEARASGIRMHPPMVGLMQMKDQAGSRRGYEISQEIQFPTKIYKEKQVRDHELQAQLKKSNFQQTSILADARVAYVAFWNAQQRLKILKEKLQWLRHHLKISRTTSWTDTGARLHLLEVESDADLAENEILSMESELIEKRSALKVFAPGIEVEDVLSAEPPVVSVHLEEAIHSPEVAWKQKELQARETMEDLKKQAYLPDFFIRFRSFEETEILPRNQELMVGISLPFLFFWQPKAEVAEASANRIKAEASLQKARIEFEANLSTLVKKAEAIEAQIKNLNEKLIPRAERRTKLVKNLSQRTMEGLDQHKSVMLTYLDLKVTSVNLRLEHENIVSDILRLSGQKSKVGTK